MGRVVRLELSFLTGVAFSAIERLGRGGGGHVGNESYV